jgi:putative ABC transport system substrate-binding protein
MRGKPVRKKFLFFVLTTLFLLSVNPIHAQQTGKIFRIGFLDQSTASGSVVLLDAFRQELGKLGWIEGKNITFEYRLAKGNFDRLPGLAADLLPLKLDIIVTAGGPTWVQAPKNATKTIPIVMGGQWDRGSKVR